MSKRVRVSNAAKIRAAKRVLKGETMAAVALDIGCSTPTVSHWLRSYLEMRPGFSASRYTRKMRAPGVGLVKAAREEFQHMQGA